MALKHIFMRIFAAFSFESSGEGKIYNEVKRSIKIASTAT